MTVEYHRLGNDPQNGLMLKYKLAKAITFISLAAIISITISSFLYPDLFTSFESDTESSYLPDEIIIPPSEDGSYTPPSPDSALLSAVKHASSQDIRKYSQLINQVNGFTDEWDYNQESGCGKWQEEYTQLHEKNLEILKNYKDGTFQPEITKENRPRYISYVCTAIEKDKNRGCGGLGDRMNGMISTFFYGLLTDRAYLLHWDEHNPLPLETVWEQPSINWTHNPVEMEKLFNLKNELLGYQKVAMLNQKLPVITKTILPKGSNTDFNRIWNQTFVQVRSNRGYIVNVFNHHKGYAQKLNELGLTKENAFKCITNYLFRPTIGARRFLNAYKHAFQMDSILSIGIQIRTDDSALADPSKDINDLDKWSHFFRCASELAQYKIKPNQHVVFFLITDSQHLRDQFALLNDDKQLSSVYFGDIAYKSTMVVTGLPIEHIEIDQVSKKYGTAEQRKKANIERMLPGSNSAYIENWLLAYTKYRVISPQGYGKMAAFYSGYDYTTISIPKQPSPPPTCSNEEAFISYDWLSEQWSLG